MDIVALAASTYLEKQQQLGQEYNVFRFCPHIAFIKLGLHKKKITKNYKFIPIKSYTGSSLFVYSHFIKSHM